MKHPQYTISSKLIYPAHGLVTLKRIDRRDVGGKGKLFYVLSVEANGMTVMVPWDQMKSLGIRHLVSKDDATSALTECSTLCDVVDQTWNKNYREMMELLKTGELKAAAQIVSKLRSIRISLRDLSFGERKMLDTALERIVSECAVVLGEDVNSLDVKIRAQVFDGV